MSEPLPDPPGGVLAEDVIAWRLIAFERIGFDVITAMELAADKAVDWRSMKTAVDNGCSLELAVRIFS